MSDDRPKKLLMFVQRCYVSGGKEGYLYYEITDDEMHLGEFDERNFDGESRERVYSVNKQTRKHMSGSPGMIFRVEYDPDRPSTIFSNTGYYVGQWPDQKQRAEWQMLDHTFGQELRLKKELKKAKRDDSILECLRPIRMAYSNAVGVQRSLILARAVQYITRPIRGFPA